MGLIPRWFENILGTTFELNADDVVVFMVGPSGGGKSWFINEVTNTSGLVKAGGSLRPCTKEVKAIRCVLKQDAKSELPVKGQKNIVFVDTPSFHTDLGEDKKAEKNMNRWLEKSKSKSTLVGTIYVDRVANFRPPEPTAIQKDLDSFAYTFPSTQDFEFSLPLRLRGVLTYDQQEGVIGEDRIISRRNVFQQQLRAVRSSMFQERGKLKWDTSSHSECLRRDKPEEAWNAVVALFS